MIYLTSPPVNHTFRLLWDRDRKRKGFNTRLIPWQTQHRQKPFCTCCTSTHASHVLGGKWSRTFCFTFHLVKILLTFRWKPEQNQCFSQLNTLIEVNNLPFKWSNKEAYPFLNYTELGQVLQHQCIEFKYVNVPKDDHRGMIWDHCYSTYTLIAPPPPLSVQWFWF